MYLAYGIETFSNLYDILLFKVFKFGYGCVQTIKGYERHLRWEKSVNELLLSYLYIDFQF